MNIDTLRSRPELSDFQKITDYEEAHEILQSGSFAIALHSLRTAPIQYGNLMSLVGDEHQARRRAVMTIFARPIHKRLELGLVLPLLRELLAEARIPADEYVRLDVLQLVRNSLHRLTAAVVGLDGVDTDAAAEELRLIAERIGNVAGIEYMNRDPEEVMQEGLAAKETFATKYFRPSLLRRRALVADSDDPQSLPKDLITVMLLEDCYDDSDEDLMLKESLFFLIAAANTTSHASPHVVNDLLHWSEENPTEIGCLQTYGFVRDAAWEALRLHPPLPGISRVAVANVELTSARSVAAGSFVQIDVNATNRQPEVFGSDADRFNPLRELPRQTPRFGLSFGAGSHLCPGRLLAVGAGAFTEHDVEVPVGIMTRLVYELFQYDLRIDPNDPPKRSPATRADRFGRMVLLARQRP